MLAEDKEQQNLIRRYLAKRGHERNVRFLALPDGRGSGEQYVKGSYPAQVAALRSALGKKTKALLIVAIDADMRTTEERSRQLADSLQGAGHAARGATEPIAVLIPKRNVETWIRVLTGSPVDEQSDYSSPAPDARQIQQAAAALALAVQDDPVPEGWPASLVASVPEWRRIPKA